MGVVEHAAAAARDVGRRVWPTDAAVAVTTSVDVDAAVLGMAQAVEAAAADGWAAGEPAAPRAFGRGRGRVAAGPRRWADDHFACERAAAVPRTERRTGARAVGKPQAAVRGVEDASEVEVSRPGRR